MQRTAAIFFTLLLVVFPSSITPALACRCSPPSPHESYKNALTIFEGEVISTQQEGYTPTKTLIRVEKVYKGLPEKEVLVFDPFFSTSCSNGLLVGQKYIIYAYPREDGLAVTSCSGTQRLDFSPPIDYSAINERISEIRSLDESIARDTVNKTALLKAKAAQLLYWQDYQQAETTLRQLREIEPQNRWVIESLLNVFLQLKKPQEIADLYTSEFSAPFPQRRDASNMNIAMPWSYAWIALNKEIPHQSRLFLKDLRFKDIKNSNLAAGLNSFENVHFKKALLNGSSFERGDFKKTYFINSDLSKAIFKAARFQQSGFSETNLKNADFTDATFESGSFSGDLSDTIFKNARFHQTRFSKVTLDGTDFSNAQIFNGYFTKVDFSKSILSDVQLTGSTYTCETTWPEGFDPVAAGAKMEERCEKTKQAP
ncbi:MAG: pentapeptide repeat-containing protein [Alphaproteobacteria bacterium]